MADKLKEELLGESSTPIKVIPIVEKTPTGLSEGNIWFNKGTKKLNVVRSDNTIVELGGNNVQVNKIDIVPEYMSIVKYQNLGYKLLFDLENVPTNGNQNFPYNKYFDYNHRTRNLVYLSNDSKTITLRKIPENTTINVSSSKDVRSIHCSLETTLCYLIFTDGTVGYIDTASSSPSISSISLPSGVTVTKSTNTLYILFLQGSDGKLYGIKAGSTTVEDTGYGNVQYIISNSNALYMVFYTTDGKINILSPNSYSLAKQYNLALYVSSCLYDSATQNMYATNVYTQTYAISRAGYTHYHDMHLNGMAVTFLQLQSKNLALGFDGRLYEVREFNNYTRIQTPLPIYVVAGYSDFVCLIDNAGNVHYYSVKDRQVINSNVANLQTTYSFNMIKQNRYSIIQVSGTPTYTSATPDSDYNNATTIGLTLPSTYNNNSLKIIKFTLNNSQIIQNMSSNYNNINFSYQGYRIPFMMKMIDSSNYDIYLFISDPITSTSINVVCNYSPKINYPDQYKLDPRNSVGFSINPWSGKEINFFSIPVYIDKNTYSKYRVKIITYPSTNFRISWLFNNQFPLMNKTRLVDRTIYSSTIPCAGFNSDIIFTINEIEIENMPNYGVIIKTNLKREFYLKESMFIPQSELIDNNGLYTIGTVVGEFNPSACYVVVTRII